MRTEVILHVTQSKRTAVTFRKSGVLTRPQKITSVLRHMEAHRNERTRGQKLLFLYMMRWVLSSVAFVGESMGPGLYMSPGALSLHLFFSTSIG